MPRTRWIVAAALALLGARPAAADLVLTPTAQGNYRVDLASGIGAYFVNSDAMAEVGNSSTMQTYHGHAAYAAFNIPAGMTVVGLSISGSASFLSYYPPYDGAIIFGLVAHDVTTPLADLTATYPSGAPEGVTIFQDLSGGSTYGSATVDNGVADMTNPMPMGPAFQFNLSPSAVVDANAAAQAGRAFLIGFSGNQVTNIIGCGAINLDGLKLTVRLSAVPEPGSLALLALGGAGVGVAVTRRRSVVG